MSDDIVFEPRVAVTGPGQLEEAVSALAWSSDGALLAAGSLGGDVVLCRADGKVLRRLDARAPVVTLEWSPLPTGLLAAGCEDGGLWVWPAGAAPVRHSSGGGVEHLAWGRMGLAAAAGDHVVLLDEAGGQRRDLPTAAGGAIVVAWTGRDRDARLLAGGLGGVREVAFASQTTTSWAFAAVVALAVDPTTATVAAGTLGGDVELIGSDDGVSARLCAGRDAVGRLTWSWRASCLAVVVDGRLRVWTLRSPEGAGLAGPLDLQGHRDWVVDGAFSPAGGLLASVGLDGRLCLWDPSQTPDPIERLDLAGELATVAWHPGGEAVAVGGPSGNFWVLHVGPALPSH